MKKFRVEVETEERIRLWEEWHGETEEPPAPLLFTPDTEPDCRFKELLELDGQDILVDFKTKTWTTVE